MKILYQHIRPLVTGGSVQVSSTESIKYIDHSSEGSRTESKDGDIIPSPFTERKEIIPYFHAGTGNSLVLFVRSLTLAILSPSGVEADDFCLEVGSGGRQVLMNSR